MILLSLTADGTSGIPGDSTIVGHEKWIACQNLTMDVSREATSNTTTKGTDSKRATELLSDVAEAHEINITKSADCASCLLMHYAASGIAVPTSAKIHFLTSGNDQEATLILEVVLERPIIADWSLSGDEDTRPTESVKIRYDKVSLKYWQFDGLTRTATTPKGWDRKLAQDWSGATHAQ